jgi:hypothetical protein
MATAHADAVVTAADTPIVGARRWQNIVEVPNDTLRADARAIERAVRGGAVDAIRVRWSPPRIWLASWRRMAAASQTLAEAARLPVIVPSPPSVMVWHARWPGLLLEHTLVPIASWSSEHWGTSLDAARQQTRFATARMRGLVLRIDRADAAFTARAWLSLVYALSREGRVLGASWHGWTPDCRASLEAACEAILLHGLLVSEIPWTPTGLPAEERAVRRAVTEPLLSIYPVNLRSVDEVMLARVPGIGRDAARRLVEGRKLGGLRSRTDLTMAGVDLNIARTWIDLSELSEAP